MPCVKVQFWAFGSPKAEKSRGGGIMPLLQVIRSFQRPSRKGLKLIEESSLQLTDDSSLLSRFKQTFSDFGMIEEGPVLLYRLGVEDIIYKKNGLKIIFLV